MRTEQKNSLIGAILIILALLTIPMCDWDATAALFYITMGVIAIREGNKKARTHRNRTTQNRKAA